MIIGDSHKEINQAYAYWITPGALCFTGTLCKQLRNDNTLIKQRAAKCIREALPSDPAPVQILVAEESIKLGWGAVDNEANLKLSISFYFQWRSPCDYTQLSMKQKDRWQSSQRGTKRGFFKGGFWVFLINSLLSPFIHLFIYPWDCGKFSRSFFWFIFKSKNIWTCRMSGGEENLKVCWFFGFGRVFVFFLRGQANYTGSVRISEMKTQ